MDKDLKQLLEDAEKQKLIDYLLNLAENNDWIRNELYMTIGKPQPELEMEYVKNLINESIRTNTVRGSIGYRGCDNICIVLDKCTAVGEKYYNIGDMRIALDIISYVLGRAVGLCTRADSSSGMLVISIEQCLENIRKICVPGSDDSYNCNYLIKLASKKVFTNYDDAAVQLFIIASQLVTAKNADKLKDAFEKLMNQTYDGGKYLKDSQIEIEYNIIKKLNGEQDALSYAYKNLDMDNMREAVVYAAIQAKNYKEAEKLCIEAGNMNTGIRKYRDRNKWHEILFGLYRETGDTNKQAETAKQLIFRGDRKYYDELKNLYMQSGEWEEKYPQLRAELKEKLPCPMYAVILQEEKEWRLLLELMNSESSLVETYAECVAPYYPEQVYNLYSNIILSKAAEATGRRGYKYICRMILKLADMGGTAMALDVVNRLRSTYPRRSSLMDELDKTELKINRTKNGK